MGHSTNILTLRAGVSFKWRVFFVSSHFINYYYDLNLAYNLSYKYLYYLFKFKYNFILLRFGLIFAFMRIKNNNLQSNNIKIFLYDTFFYKKVLNEVNSKYNHKIVRTFLSNSKKRKYKYKEKWRRINQKRREKYEYFKKRFINNELPKNFVFRYNPEFEPARKFYDFGPEEVIDPLFDVYLLLLKKNSFLYNNPLQFLQGPIKYRNFVVPFDFKTIFKEVRHPSKVSFNQNKRGAHMFPNNNNRNKSMVSKVPFYRKRISKKKLNSKRVNFITTIIRSLKKRGTFMQKPINFFFNKDFVEHKKFKRLRKYLFQVLNKKFLMKFLMKRKFKINMKKKNFVNFGNTLQVNKRKSLAKKKVYKLLWKIKSIAKDGYGEPEGTIAYIRDKTTNRFKIEKKNINKSVKHVYGIPIKNFTNDVNKEHLIKMFSQKLDNLPNDKFSKFSRKQMVDAYKDRLYNIPTVDVRNKSGSFGNQNKLGVVKQKDDLLYDYRKSFVFKKLKLMVSNYIIFDKFRMSNFYILNEFFKGVNQKSNKFLFFKKHLKLYSKFKKYMRNRKNMKKSVLSLNVKQSTSFGVGLNAFFTYNLYSLNRFFLAIGKLRRAAILSRFYLVKKHRGKLFYKMKKQFIVDGKFSELKKNSKLSLKPKLMRKLFYQLYLKRNKNISFESRKNDFMSYFNLVVSRVFYKNFFYLKTFKINKLSVFRTGNKGKIERKKRICKMLPIKKRRIVFNNNFIMFLVRLFFKLRFAKMYKKFKKLKSITRNRKFVYSFMYRLWALKARFRKNIDFEEERVKRKMKFKRWAFLLLRRYIVTCLFYRVDLLPRLIARIQYLFKIYKSWFFYKFYRKFLLMRVFKSYESLACIFRIKLVLFLKSFGYCSNNMEVKMFPLAPEVLSLDLLAIFIDWKLKKKFTLNQIVYPFLRHLERSKNFYVRGIAIKAAGRFTRKQRAGLRRYVRGCLTYSTFRRRTSFSFFRIITKYGSCGLKMWVSIYKHRLRKKVNKKLYLVNVI